MHYDFARIQKTLRVTPAMEAECPITFVFGRNSYSVEVRFKRMRTILRFVSTILVLLLSITYAEPLGGRGTRLIFRTPAGAVSIPAGQRKTLGVLPVLPYKSIRVVADERPGCVPCRLPESPHRRGLGSRGR
jgi:hypothetical protein